MWVGWQRVRNCRASRRQTPKFPDRRETTTSVGWPALSAGRLGTGERRDGSDQQPAGRRLEVVLSCRRRWGCASATIRWLSAGARETARRGCAGHPALRHTVRSAHGCKPRRRLAETLTGLLRPSHWSGREGEPLRSPGMLETSESLPESAIECATTPPPA